MKKLIFLLFLCLFFLSCRVYTITIQAETKTSLEIKRRVKIPDAEEIRMFEDTIKQK